MRKLIILLILFMTLPAFAKDVYKWTNAEGVVIYSDTYQEGAERIRITEGQTPASPSGADESEAQSGSGAEGETVDYTSLEIVQPANDATIRSNEGSVAVGLTVSPALGQGHSVEIIVDGTQLEGSMKGTQFTLNNLNRGTHSLQTRVVDAEGNVLISSNPISFHLRQASIIKP
jgi:hypothetical protein